MGDDAEGESRAGYSDYEREVIERVMGRKVALFFGEMYGDAGEMHRSRVGDAGTVFVAEKLRGNTIVESLALGSCRISAVGARALAGTLGEHNATLNFLLLDDNDVGDDGAEAIALMLKKSTTLEDLFLARCGIGACGARALAATLGEHNDTLKSLVLDENGSLGDDGAEAIALMLKKNTALEELELRDCGIGACGARALGEALTENATLKDLGLFGNDFGNEGAEAFAEALRWNESLECLNLCECGLTDIGASSLLGALRESNSTLKDLVLYDDDGVPGCPNDISDEDLKYSIEELLEENRAVAATAERRARCLLFCCLKLAPTAHEHVVPSIGAVPVPVMQYAVEHAGSLYLAKRFEHGDAVAGQSSAGVRPRSLSHSSVGEDLESAAARRRSTS